MALTSSIHQAVHARLSIPLNSVRYVLSQAERGATVPFLARYRRDETGNLDEGAIRRILDTATEAKDVEQRRKFMMSSLEERRLLTPKLRDFFMSVTHLNELEDAWEPYKVRKTSLASRGREAGFRVDELLHTAASVQFLFDLLRKVKDGEKLLVAVIVEEVSRNDCVRSAVMRCVEKSAVLHTRVVPTPRKNAAKALRADEFTKLQKMFSNYDDRSWSANTVKSHTVLAIQRGEDKGVLQVSMTCNHEAQNQFRQACKEQFGGILQRQRNRSSPDYQLLVKGLQATFTYLVEASFKSVRRDLKKRSEDTAIEVFSSNLRHVLLQRPLTQARILAMDPGLRNGVKCVALDESGDILTTLKCSVLDEKCMARQLKEVVEKWELNKIVIGNGTASQPTASVVSRTIAEAQWPNVEFAIVSEAGASVYSVSEAANEEFPQLDILFRGAVSIGRRVLDPLSELVKIPVKSMGIGMYQHDVNEKQLLRTLNETVESCVASVGVNSAVASKYLMQKVPAISKQLVNQIILSRHSKKLNNREDLRQVPSMSEPTYSQIVGFFRFPNSTEPLDNTVLLPEWYGFVRQLHQTLFPPASADGAAATASELSRARLTSIGEHLASLDGSAFQQQAAELGCGVECLRLIQKELLQPGLDPRSSLPHAGVMRKQLRKAEELKKGEQLTGVVQSVTTFGCFVDCGLDQAVLLRELSMGKAFPGELIENITFTHLDQVGRVQAFVGTPVQQREAQRRPRSEMEEDKVTSKRSRTE